MPRISILRTLLPLIALGAALALAGCGGTSTQAIQPRLPHGIAADLADRSEAIAAALDSGDTCQAAQLADELRDAVDSALAGGQVPAAFRGQLERTAADLQNEVNCTEKPKGHSKGKGKHHDKNEETTTTLGTTTSLSTTTGVGD